MTAAHPDPAISLVSDRSLGLNGAFSLRLAHIQQADGSSGTNEAKGPKACLLAAHLIADAATTPENLANIRGGVADVSHGAMVASVARAGLHANAHCAVLSGALVVISCVSITKFPC